MRWPAYWRRFLIIAGAAALVSVGTYFVFPGAFVFFGILHCIAAASLVALPFLFLPAFLDSAAPAGHTAESSTSDSSECGPIWPSVPLNSVNSAERPYLSINALKSRA